MNAFKDLFCSGKGILHRVSRGCKSFPIDFSSKTKSKADILGQLCQPEWNSPGTIYLAGGFPNPWTFPFDEISFKISSGRSISVQGEEMSQILQYDSCQGYAPLVTSLKSWMTNHHNVGSWESSDLAVTLGSADALGRILGLVLDPETALFSAGPLFGNAPFWIEKVGCKFIAVEKDHLGVKPAHLIELAQITEEVTKKMVLLLDHSGSDTSNKRDADKRAEEIFEVAEAFNMIVIEIDPYFFLRLPKSPLSLLSLDEGRRVLRCDSFSWLFGPGLRIGWVTGPVSFIEMIASSIDTSVIHASNISQMFVSKTLDSFGEDGVRVHSQKVYDQLKKERERLLQAARIHLGDRTEWGIYPEAPFLWFKLNDISVVMNKLIERREFITAHIDENHSTTNTVTLGTWFSGASEEETIEKCKHIGQLIYYFCRPPP